MNHCTPTISRQHGFSMIEILITLVIIATALLGTAGLQLYAMKVGKNSEFRTQAIFLASDLAERMEANKPAAITGGYAASSVVPTTALIDCTTNACNADNLAKYDLSQWEAAVANLLPGSSWEVSPTITNTTSSVSATYNIALCWVDHNSSESSTPPSSGNDCPSDPKDPFNDPFRFRYLLSRTLHYCPPTVAGCT